MLTYHGELLLRIKFQSIIAFHVNLIKCRCSILDNTLEMCNMQDECEMSHKGDPIEWNRIKDNTTGMVSVMRNYFVDLHQAHVKDHFGEPFIVDDHSKIVIEEMFLARYFKIVYGKNLAFCLGNISYTENKVSDRSTTTFLGHTLHATLVLR